MNTLRLPLFVLFLGAAFNCNAQDIEKLPVTATGARALPHVTVKVGVFSFYWGRFVTDSTQKFIWGKAGDAIDENLDLLGVDITNDSGVVQYSVLFRVLGRTPVTITGEIDKLEGESLKEAMERNYGEGDLDPVSTGEPSGTGTGNDYMGGMNYRARDSVGDYVIINVDYTWQFSCTSSGCAWTANVLGINLYSSNGSTYVGPDYSSLVQQPTAEIGGY